MAKADEILNLDVVGLAAKLRLKVTSAERLRGRARLARPAPGSCIIWHIMVSEDFRSAASGVPRAGSGR